jgi:hypothetical protein
MNKTLKNALNWKGVPLQIFIERNTVEGCRPVPEFNFVTKGKMIEGERNIDMHEKFNWSNIVSTIGLFPSASIAKKSGWDIPIEDGYSEAVFRAKTGEFIFVFIDK